MSDALNDMLKNEAVRVNNTFLKAIIGERFKPIELPKREMEIELPERTYYLNETDWWRIKEEGQLSIVDETGYNVVLKFKEDEED